MPSIRACAVQPVMNKHTRMDTIFAPGAAPVMAPPNSWFPPTMPATCEPCWADTMPMLTALFFPSVWTTNGIASRTGVAGLSVPK